MNRSQFLAVLAESAPLTNEAPDRSPEWDELPDAEVEARQDWDFITENGVNAVLLKERL